jgi:hypothetical protein
VFATYLLPVTTALSVFFLGLIVLFGGAITGQQPTVVILAIIWFLVVPILTGCESNAPTATAPAHCPLWSATQSRTINVAIAC